MSLNNTEGLISKKDLVNLLGITAQAFDYWGVRPVKKVRRQNYYSLSDVLDNRIENALSKNTKTYKTSDLGEIDIELERAGLTREQRITQQHKNSILEGRAIPVQVVAPTLARVLAQVGATLDSIAPHIKRRHPEIDNRVINFIKSEIIRYQNEAIKLDEYLDEIIDAVISEAEAKI
jgi:phage terminase Nu1 subunit (DNA packaging protein)